jgi:hypothetical protein
MPALPSMRPRGSGDALLILFAYLETVPLYNSRFPMPDTLPLLPCGAGGFAGGSDGRGHPGRCRCEGENRGMVVPPNVYRARIGALGRGFRAKESPGGWPGLFGDDPLDYCETASSTANNQPFG